MQIHINKHIDTPIFQQIQSAIEYAVSLGYLKTNDTLPSVRVLAQQLQVAPLTIRKAYSALQNKGLITTIHGKGSIVCEKKSQAVTERNIFNTLDTAVVECLLNKVSPAILEARVLKLLNYYEKQDFPALSIAIFGNYKASLALYANSLKGFFEPIDQFSMVTINEASCLDLSQYDLVMTAPHYQHGLEKQLQGQPPVFSAPFVPTWQTCNVLKQLPAEQTIYACVPDFSFKTYLETTIRQQAPQVGEIIVVTAAEIDSIFGVCRHLVLSVGCRDVIPRLPASIHWHYFFYSFDPVVLEYALKPQLLSLRLQKGVHHADFQP